ncbi:MAG: DUF4198 domain-containing protein [Phycisphaerales bacterium]
MRHFATRIALCICALLFAGAAAAHEFWIQPATFRPAAGAVTPVRLLVGDGFPGEGKPRDPKRLERFDVIGPGKDEKARPVEGKDGAEPAGIFKAEKPGVHALVYRSKEATIELEAEKFEGYLRDEGLQKTIEDRATRGESAKAGREAYSRCAKALVCAGDDPAGAWNVRAGLALEIVPETNPFQSHAGDKLTFLLIEDGKPCADAQVNAMTEVEGKTRRTTMRTGPDGKVTLELKSPGLWVLNVVRMRRAENRSDVDWVSVWSTLTFDLAPAPVAPLGIPAPAR